MADVPWRPFGRRYSSLTKINSKNIDSLGLRLDLSPHRRPSGSLKSTPLQVNGRAVLHPRPITCGRSTRAPDARSGTTSGSPRAGTIRQSRGRHLWKLVYFLTPDCNIVSLNVKDGKERWQQDQLRYRPFLLRLHGAHHHQEPHIIAGVSGDDLDRPGISAPTIPRPATCNGAGGPCRRRRAIPAVETWPNEEAMTARRRHDLADADLRSRAQPALHHTGIRSP
jgi:alcohol dehydrogenase (cytochrome c)